MHKRPNIAENANLIGTRRLRDFNRSNQDIVSRMNFNGNSRCRGNSAQIDDYNIIIVFAFDLRAYKLIIICTCLV